MDLVDKNCYRKAARFVYKYRMGCCVAICHTADPYASIYEQQYESMRRKCNFADFYEQPMHSLWFVGYSEEQQLIRSLLLLLYAEVGDLE